MTTFLKNWGIPFSIGIATVFCSMVATSFVASRSLRNDKILNAASETFVTDANEIQSEELTIDFTQIIGNEADRITENETNIEELDKKVDKKLEIDVFEKFEERFWKKWDVQEQRLYDLLKDK